MSGTELLRAALFHTPANPFRDPGALRAYPDGGLLIRDGRIVGAGDFAAVRALAPAATLVDYRGGYILPGFVDAHVHFPQLRIVGSLGRSLLDWLEAVALPEEARLADLQYAQTIARSFVAELVAHGTTSALVFGAHYAPATAALFDEAAALGVRLTSGLVLSDRRLRPELHQSPATAYEDATLLIGRFHGRGRLQYAVTPRFALSASEAMLEVCHTLLIEHPGLRVQSHLNENEAEVHAVRELFPWAADYLHIYERYALAGPHAVFAHSVWSTDRELERLAATRSSIAHCPCSNAALGSGVFPMRRHLAAGVHCALGTDVGAGIGLSVVKEALFAYLSQRQTPGGTRLQPAHLLYLSTLAGALALGLDGLVGDFSEGKAADFVYLRPRPASILAGALDRAQSSDEALAVLVSLASVDDIREVRIEGAVVHTRGSDG